MFLKSKNIIYSADTIEWTKRQLFIFRITFIYILFLCVPIDKMLFAYLGQQIDWTDINCRDLFIIATYKHISLIDLYDNEGFKWGLLGYVNFILPVLIAIPVALLWTWLAKEKKEYDTLQYWLQVVLRYRVGLGMIAWGYRKLMPSQMVLPTYSILNTPFGDIQAQKHYWQSVGIVPGYEVFLGFAEFIPGILLLFRKTSALGATLTFVVMINVALANHAYDGSVHIHSFCYAILAFIILYQDLPGITNLLIKEKDTSLNKYYPSLSGFYKYFRIGAKSFVFLVFVFWFFALQVKDYLETPYRLPKVPGIGELRGFYNVEEFKINGKLLPYNPLDSVRWQEAIFEKWRTMSFTVNKPSVIDRSNGGGYTKKDIDRKWEVAGIAGGKKWFHYEADTIDKTLYLQNKNNIHCGDKNLLHYIQQYGAKSVEDSGESCNEQFTFRYNIISESKVILTGYNEKKESLYIVLHKQDVKYPLLEGRESDISTF